MHFLLISVVCVSKNYLSPQLCVAAESPPGEPQHRLLTGGHRQVLGQAQTPSFHVQHPLDSYCYKRDDKEGCDAPICLPFIYTGVELEKEPGL